MQELQGLSLKVFNDRYALKDGDGQQVGLPLQVTDVSGCHLVPSVCGPVLPLTEGGYRI